MFAFHLNIKDCEIENEDDQTLIIRIPADEVGDLLPVAKSIRSAFGTSKRETDKMIELLFEERQRLALLDRII